MIEYLLPEEFKKRYPISTEHMASGGQGKIYKSGKYAIKVFKKCNIFELMAELNYYAFLCHPCILKPLAWTFNKNGYIAMPLGIDIKEAYESKLITIEEIVSDTLSAISYMHSLNVIHYDVKSSNIIYHD